MPTVPTINTSISSDVSTAGAQSRYAPGSATLGTITQVGESAARLGMALMKETVDAEAEIFSETQSLQDKLDAEAYIAKLKLENPTGIIMDSTGAPKKVGDKEWTISDEYHAWADKRFQDNQMRMPTKIAQSLYQKKAMGLFTNGSSQVRNDEIALRVQTLDIAIEDSIQKSQNSLLDNPQMDDAYSFRDKLKLMVKSVEGKVIGRQEAEKRLDLIDREMPEKYFEGLKIKALEQPKGGATRTDMVMRALSELRGQDRNSQIRKSTGLDIFSDTMDPDRKDQLERDFLGLLDAAKRADASGWNRKAEAYQSQTLLNLQIGGPQASQNLKREHDALITQALKLYRNGSEGFEDAFAFSEKVTPLFATQMAATLATDESWKYASPEQKLERAKKLQEKLYTEFAQNMIVNADSPMTENEQLQFEKIVGGTMRKNVFERLTQIISQDDNLAKEDFPKFIKGAREVKAYTAGIGDSFANPRLFAKGSSAAAFRARNEATRARAQMYGLPQSDFKLLDKDEADKLAFFINTEPSYTNVGQGLLAMSKADPAGYVQSMDQLVRTGKIDARWRLAVHVSGNSMLLNDVVQAIRFDLSKSGISLPPGVTPSEVSEAVREVSYPYVKSLLQRGVTTSISDDEIKLVQDVVTNHTYKVIAGGTKDVEAAAKSAVDSLFGRQFNLVQSGGGGRNPITRWWSGPGRSDNLLLPKSYQGQNIGKQEIQNLEGNRRYYVSPQGLKEIGAVPPPGAEDVGENFYEYVEKTGGFSVTPDGSGVFVWYMNKYNQPTQVMTKQKDRNGNPVPLRLPLSQVIAPPKKKAAPLQMAPAQIPQTVPTGNPQLRRR